MQLIQNNNVCGLYQALVKLPVTQLGVLENRQVLGTFARELIQLLAQFCKEPGYDKISNAAWLRHLHNFVTLYQNDPDFNDPFRAAFELMSVLIDLSPTDITDPLEMMSAIRRMREIDADLCNSYQYPRLELATDISPVQVVDNSNIVEHDDIMTLYHAHHVNLDIRELYPTLTLEPHEDRLWRAMQVVVNGSPLLRVESDSHMRYGFGGRRPGRSTLHGIFGG